MEISTQVVALLGLGAVLKYSYQVFCKGSIKSLGALITMFYMTIIYMLLSWPSFSYHGGQLVRVGVTLIFLDKIFVFFYDLLFRKWEETKGIKKVEEVEGYGG